MLAAGRKASTLPRGSLIVDESLVVNEKWIRVNLQRPSKDNHCIFWAVTSRSLVNAHVYPKIIPVTVFDVPFSTREILSIEATPIPR